MLGQGRLQDADRLRPDPVHGQQIAAAASGNLREGRDAGFEQGAVGWPPDRWQVTDPRGDVASIHTTTIAVREYPRVDRSR